MSVYGILLLKQIPKPGRTKPSTGPRVGQSCVKGTAFLRTNLLFLFTLDMWSSLPLQWNLLHLRHRFCVHWHQRAFMLFGVSPPHTL